ncbi:MAG: hypothetical protein ACE5OQ_01460 [Woeseia sp.]
MSKYLGPGTELSEQPSTESVVSEQQVQIALENLRTEQSLVNGTVAGIVAAIVGAGIWAVVTVMTENQIGWMAIGIGFLVGFAVRFAGKGIDKVFGIIGAALSLVGCALGNVFAITYFIAINEGIAFTDVLGQLEPAIVFELLISTFEVMDLLFYGLAAYFGYRYAFRQITEEDYSRALGKSL